jgi:hypothetical protein
MQNYGKYTHCSIPCFSPTHSDDRQPVFENIHWNIQHGQYIYIKYCLSIRNIPHCWHCSNFTTTTLHYSPTNVTNPTCHDEVHISRFNTKATSFFFICYVTSCQGRTNPLKLWIPGLSLADVAWYWHFYLWVYGAILATCICYCACNFQVATKYLEHVYIRTSCYI